MSGHTPGPWTFSQSTQYGDARFYVAQQEGAPYTPHYSDVATLIAETVGDERRSIQEANARLIAAAPELLEALQSLLASDRSDPNEIVGQDVDGHPLNAAGVARKAARAAIAKAVQP